MSKFEESNFYKALQDFFINADKKTFLQFLAEFYNRTEGIIDKNNIQDDLIKELRDLYLEFNEKGIDENIVREKVNYFLENSVKIENINKKISKVDNKKLDKTGIITMGNLGQDIKEAMTGGSVAVVGKNSVGDENVKFSSLGVYKTDFIKTGNNLLNRKALVNGFLKGDGTITVDDNYKTTNIIPVNGVTHITLARTNKGTTTLGGARDIRYVEFYNSNLQPITASFYNNSSSTAETVSIPSAAVYLRLSFKASYDDGTTMIYFGENKKYGYYEDYHEIIENIDFSKTTKQLIQNNVRKYLLENKVIDLNSLNFVEKIGSNLWNNESYTQGFLKNDGTITTDAGYLTSDYILIKGNRITPFKYTGSSSSIAYIRKLSYYDENLKPMVDIFYDNGSKTNEGIDLNQKATYIRFSIGKELNNSIMVVYGDIPPVKYEPYKYKLKNVENDILDSNPLQGKIIYNFGDSIAAGDGNNGKGYAELLAEKYGMNVTDYAKGGATLGSNTTNNITTQVDNAITTGKSPDYILINGGTNDVVNSTTLGTIASDYTLSTIDKTTTSGGLEYCFNKLKGAFPDTKIVFVSVHKMGSRDYTKQRECQKRCIDICNKWGIPVADVGNKGNLNTFLPSMYKFTNPTDTQPNGDRTHPNQLGYEKFYLPIIYNVLTSI